MLSFEQVKTIAGKYSDIVIKESASGRMLFTIYGGRLLGMWPKADGNNPLWVYPDLDETMKNGQWMIGGERLWIAPERRFFYENPRDFDGFHVPAEIDPGEYVGTADLTFESVFSLLDYGRNETFDGSLCKRTFEIIDDPYAASIPYAGVRITDTVSIPGANLGVCGWSLAQVYTCGPDMPATALFPAKTGSAVLSYFAPIPPDRAEVLDGYARFKIDAHAVYKMALRPEDMVMQNPCKAVYLTPSPDGKSWMCLIKRSDDMPRSQDECVDEARDNPNGPKGAIQAYNNGPDFAWPGSEFPYFGEIELQMKKSSLNGGKMISVSTHELLAYEGSKDAVLALAAQALDIASEPKLY